MKTNILKGKHPATYTSDVTGFLTYHNMHNFEKLNDILKEIALPNNKYNGTILNYFSVNDILRRKQE